VDGWNPYNGSMKRRALAGALLPAVLASPLLAVWCVLCLSQQCSPEMTGEPTVVVADTESVPPCHMATHEAASEPASASIMPDGCCKMISEAGAESLPAVAPVDPTAPALTVPFTTLAPWRVDAPRHEPLEAPPPEPSPPLYTLHSSWLI